MSEKERGRKGQGNEAGGSWFKDAVVIAAIIGAFGTVVAAVIYVAPDLIECLRSNGPTPTPKVILLEDFEPQRAMNWWSPDSKVFQYAETNSRADGGAYSLQVDYAKTDTYQFIAAEIPSHRRNFQATNELQVSVYGEVTLLVKLEDEDLQQAEVCTVSGTNAAGWSRLSCDYTGVESRIDLGHVKNIFLFPAPGDNAAKGTFYLDRLLVKE